MIEHEPSCLDVLEDPALTPFGVARERMTAMITPPSQRERVPLHAATGRVLAVDVKAVRDVPPHDNAAMDGYAIHSSSIPVSGEASLRLIDTARAGEPASRTVQAGEAIRILTGARMPVGADTVVAQERVHANRDEVSIDASAEAGRNVRKAGEDVAIGESVLARGRRLGAAECGVLASLGLAELEVYARPRIAVLSTGDELCALEQHEGGALPYGALFDSNRPVLLSLLRQLELEVHDLGIIGDSDAQVTEALHDASGAFDAIISSGGVSGGDFDHVGRILERDGELAFWRVAMRPGRPLAVGRLARSMVYALPGNPVAVMVGWLQFVRPGLLMQMGATLSPPLEVEAIATAPIRKIPGRYEFQRGVLERGAAGELEVRTTGRQGAGRLSSVVVANALIVLPPESSGVAAGERVRVQPFSGLFDS